MITIGLLQEHIELRRLNAEQSKLFDCPENYLTIGVFVRNIFCGIFSIGSLYGYLHLSFFHVLYPIPFIARRMAKFVKSLGRATKKGQILVSYFKNDFENQPKGQGLLFFKNYFNIKEYGNNPALRQFVLEV